MYLEENSAFLMDANYAATICAVVSVWYSIVPRQPGMTKAPEKVFFSKIWQAKPLLTH